MGPVSVYRVGAVGADPSYFFGGEARGSDLRHAAWLGWLPLTLVEFAGPGVAVTDDTWLTAPAGCPEPPRRPLVGDVVSALDAAAELIARRDSGLAVFTNCSGDVVSDGPVWASSVAVLVADDLAAHVDRLRTAYFAVVETLDGVEQERRLWTPARAVRLLTRPCDAATAGLCGTCRRSSFGFTCCSMRRSGSGYSMLPRRVVESGFSFPEAWACFGVVADDGQPGALLRGVVRAYAVVGGVSPGPRPVSAEVANAVSAP